MESRAISNRDDGEGRAWTSTSIFTFERAELFLYSEADWNFGS